MIRTYVGIPELTYGGGTDIGRVIKGRVEASSFGGLLLKLGTTHVFL